MKSRAIENMIRKRRAELILFASGFKYCRNEAQDIVQECSIELWEAVCSGKEIDNPFHYMLRMVRNRCIDVARKKERHTGVDTAIPECGEEQAPAVEYMEMESFIRHEMENMSEGQQSAFRMKEFLGLENREIAEILETSETNVRQMLSRARKHLKMSIMKNRML